jgi:uncharacterized membrane protein YuzA (DUF378 family)
MKDQNEHFNYTYSASMQEEIEAIRKKYTENTSDTYTDKMGQLRKLDASVSQKASVASLCVGILSVLIMGIGMSFIMTDVGHNLGIANTFICGLIIGIIGMAGVISAYPIYRCVTKKQRKKIAPQILRLTDELSQQ